ncbi:Pectate lyase [Dillenia turbinata]|uniref:Pectate lyase n=1 Tax=Dillenia turbinata TaxID=194707 RepID=A0AAN8ZCG8_9MAGN
MARAPLSLLLSLSFILYNASTLAGASYYSPSYYYNQPAPYKEVMNTIDSCWRSNPNWSSNRQALANCAIGFGKDAIGGKFGEIYVVTDSSDDPVNPKPGTLRYGAIQNQPLWIIFDKDMLITLENELMVNSYKTIDGRGAKVEIAHGPCITIADVSHVIVHGISIHDCTPGKPGLVRSTPNHVGHRLGSDGDAITVFASSYVWIDHCYLARCFDGLIDRMPRVRFGYAHVANNKYDEWLMYAIGGSADPTILSEGNYFTAPNDPYFKQVTKRDTDAYWKNWKWRSSRDIFQNGAYFVPSGWGTCSPGYTPAQYFSVAPGGLVPALTSDSGPLNCALNRSC